MLLLQAIDYKDVKKYSICLNNLYANVLKYEEMVNKHTTNISTHVCTYFQHCRILK